VVGQLDDSEGRERQSCVYQWLNWTSSRKRRLSATASSDTAFQCEDGRELSARVRRFTRNLSWTIRISSRGRLVAIRPRRGRYLEVWNQVKAR